MSKKIRGRIQRLTLFLATHATSTPVKQGCALARPGARTLFSRHPLKVSPLAALAGLRRRRHRHPRPRTHFGTWIVVEKKMAVNSIVNGCCEFEGVCIDLKLLVTRVVHRTLGCWRRRTHRARCRHSEIGGLEGRRLRRALTKKRVGYVQIATPKTEASPPSTLGADGQRDALLIPSCCDGRQCVGSEFVLGCMCLIPSNASSIAASNKLLDGGFDVEGIMDERGGSNSFGKHSYPPLLIDWCYSKEGQKIGIQDLDTLG